MEFVVDGLILLLTTNFMKRNEFIKGFTNVKTLNVVTTIKLKAIKKI